MSPRSALAWPPRDPETLRRLPVVDDAPSHLHRLSERPAPWWFATRPADPADGGRFELPMPEGTCHLAETLEGALLEKLLRTPKRAVPAMRLEQLFHARIAVRRLPSAVDLTEPLTGLGLNAEIHTTLDYAKPRAWAVAIRAAGWKALRYLLRGDNALRLRGLAMFGRAGLHQRAPAGLRTEVAPLDVNEAHDVLTSRGVAVLPVPTLDELPLTGR